MGVPAFLFGLLFALGTVAAAFLLLPKSARSAETGRERLVLLVPPLALLLVAVAVLFPRVIPLLLAGVFLLHFGRAAFRRRLKMKADWAVKRELPTLVDALVLNIEAGHSLIPSFLQAKEVLSKEGPLAREIDRMESDLRLGLSQSEALSRMLERLGSPEAETFLESLIQALELGTPVSRVLREQSGRMREHLLLEGEKFANTLSLRLLVPLFLFIFPSAFLLILAPVLVALLDNRPW